MVRKLIGEVKQKRGRIGFQIGLCVSVGVVAEAAARLAHRVALKDVLQQVQQRENALLLGVGECQSSRPCFDAPVDQKHDELPAALPVEGEEVFAAVAGELGFVRLAFGELTDDVSEVEGVLFFLFWLCFAVPCLRR